MLAKNAAKILKPNHGFFPIPHFPLYPSSAQRQEIKLLPLCNNNKPACNISDAHHGSNDDNKDHNSVSHFHINRQKLSLLEKWNFPVFTFLHQRTGHFHCLGSYLQISLHTHFKPHSLKQVDNTLNKNKRHNYKKTTIVRIYFLYRRKVLSKRVI